MSVKLLTEHHLEFLGFKAGCTGSYESTLVKMSNCWKSHALAQLLYEPLESNKNTRYTQRKLWPVGILLKKA